MAHTALTMRSLRGRLLLWLSLTVCAVGAGAAVLAYLTVNGEAKSLLDQQMQQVASIVAARTVPGQEATEDSDIEVSVWDADGTPTYSSTARVALPKIATPGFSEIILKGEPYRVYATDLGGKHIVVAQPVDMRDDQAEDAAAAALLPTLTLLPVLALVIALVIRTLLQPLRAIAATIAQRGALSPGTLEARSLPSEIAPMIGEIDRLLERQNEALRRENAFLADAAHALRTPLAALQLQADVLDGSSDAGERAARLAALRSGIRRAARLSDQLLSLARIDAATDTAMECIDVEAALYEVAELYGPAVAAAHNHLTIAAASGARVRCDMRRLLLICTNLLDNALHHSPRDGRIQLLSGATSECASIEVWDEGPGLPAAELARVFQRFYRAPNAQGDGSGLGLSTVESLVKQLGGSVMLENRRDRSGLIARVTLPRLQADNPAVRKPKHPTDAAAAASAAP